MLWKRRLRAMTVILVVRTDSLLRCRERRTPLCGADQQGDLKANFLGSAGFEFKRRNTPSDPWCFCCMYRDVTSEDAELIFFQVIPHDGVDAYARRASLASMQAFSSWVIS